MKFIIEELTHVILGTEKSYPLPSASWKPRKAGGVIQSKSKGLNQGSRLCKYKSEGSKIGGR